MTTELWLLFLSLPVYGLYLGAQSLIFRMDYGIKYAATARDDKREESALLGRSERALKNFHETWMVYVILALIAHLAMPGDPLLFWGAIVYLAGRVLFLPLYLAGTNGLRSLVWNLVLIGLLMMTFAVLF